MTKFKGGVSYENLENPCSTESVGYWASGSDSFCNMESREISYAPGFSVFHC
jgi:hypothetical protein